MKSRYPIIERIVSGKSVLDIGSISDATYGLWNKMTPLASEIIGLDIVESNDLRIHQGNVESYNFNRTFDVICFGSTLEHVDNQGIALDNMYRHLADDGVIIVTVPNAKWWSVIFKPNTEHVLWHDKYTLTALLDRHGFYVEELHYYYGSKPDEHLFWRLIYAQREILAVCKKKKTLSPTNARNYQIKKNTASLQTPTHTSH